MAAVPPPTEVARIIANNVRDLETGTDPMCECLRSQMRRLRQGAEEEDGGATALLQHHQQQEACKGSCLSAFRFWENKAVAVAATTADLPINNEQQEWLDSIENRATSVIAECMNRFTPDTPELQFRGLYLLRSVALLFARWEAGGGSPLSVDPQTVLGICQAIKRFQPFVGASYSPCRNRPTVCYGYSLREIAENVDALSRVMLLPSNLLSISLRGPSTWGCTKEEINSHDIGVPNETGATVSVMVWSPQPRTRYSNGGDHSIPPHSPPCGDPSTPPHSLDDD